MNKPELRICKCHHLMKCNCAGWNEACEEWENYFEERESGWALLLASANNDVKRLQELE